MHRLSNPFSHLLNLVLVLSISGSLRVVSAQNGASPQGTTQQLDTAKGSSKTVSRSQGESPEQKAAPQQSSPAPLIGPGDELDVAVYNAPDLSEHTRVSAGGNISMPLIGYVRVAGLSSSEAAAAIESQLRQNNILNDPQVSVYVKEYNSSGISVTGEVAKPGFYSALGPHRLFDILQAAGGPTERAANKVVISHQNSDDSITIELPKDPTELARSNVELRPGDTVVVPAAPIVYVLGEVNKPGGFVLNSMNGVTLLRVVAAAGGPTHSASVGGTKMLRNTPGGLKELRVPLKAILQAKAPDMPVQADDIIWVPRSHVKASLVPEALINTAAAVALYRIP